MFDEALHQHDIEIVSAPAGSPERKRNLASGCHWATDAIQRVDDEIRQSIVQFRRHKAEEDLPLADDEKPHEIQLHVRRAGIYLAGGWSAIFAEVVIATITIFLMISGFGLAPWLSTILAFSTATVLTLLIARLIHAAILILVERSGNPVDSRARVRKWFIRPSFILVVFTIVAYIALQRLDAETLLAVQPIVSGVMFVGMFGFVFLGASLLVVAALLSWSRPAAAHFEELLTRRERISSKREQWQHEHDEFEIEFQELPLALHSPVSEIKPATHDEPSGGVAMPPSTATKAAAMLLTGAVLFGLSGCVTTKAVKPAPTNPQVTFDLVVDASGVLNAKALKQTGEQMIRTTQPIVEQQRVTTLRVNWFGPNGWSPEPRLSLKLTPPPRFLAGQTDVGEIGKLRPDLEKAKAKSDEKAVADATSTAQGPYLAALEKELAPLSIETLIPGPEVQSPCTDINGVFARFATRTSVERQLVALITDGRQNCDTSEIKPVTWQQGVAVVIIVVPGTENDGFNDYETRKSRFAASCPWCVIVPYYREDMDAVVAEAVKKSERYGMKE
jgi:hypothetical protein